MKRYIILSILLAVSSEAQAITQTVAAGDEVNGGDVNSIVTQLVYGTTRNMTVSGVQDIMSGGKSYNSTVYNQQIVETGGTSYNTYVWSSATQRVSGEAYSSTVSSRGSISVNTGGYVEGTTMTGGVLTVASGATASGTIQKNGVYNVSGKDENATISGGTQEILSGGSSSGANITGGTQQVDAGAQSTSATISGSGRQKVYGTILNNTINSGARTTVYSGGVAENTQINGGTLEINSGGSSSNSIINSGRENVYGTATGSIINGGTQTVYSGGEAINTQIKNDGILSVRDGGTLNGTTTLTDSTINIGGSIQIPSLVATNSNININSSYDYSSVVFDNLSGSGTINMSSSLSEDLADTLSINSGSGNFGLVINDYSPSGDTPNRFKVITETGATDNFYLIGGAVDVGAFEYKLVKNGNDWYLARTDNVTDSSVIAKDTYSSLSSLFYTHLSPVYNHIRSRRNHAATDNGLWIKGLGQKLKFDYEDNSRSEIEIYGSEIGYDREIWRGGGKYLSLGVYGGFTSSRQRYDRMGRGEADTKVVGLYSVLNTDDDWFADFVSSYFWHTQKITSYTPAGEPVNGKYNTNSWQVSANVGKRLKFEESWFIEPSVGVNYMRIKGISYRTNFNTLVEADDENYLSLRADLVAGKTFTFDNGNYLDIYGRFAVIDDMDGKNTVWVADYAFSEDMSSVRYQIGAGINAGWNEQGSGYLDISTQPGSRVQIPWEINLGLQYRF